MKNILVPTDFSLCAEKEINFAVHSAKYIPAEITLYHAFDLQGDIYTDYMGVNKEYNQSLYNDIVSRLNDIKEGLTGQMSYYTEIPLLAIPSRSI